MLSLFRALAERPVAWVAGAVETSDEPVLSGACQWEGTVRNNPFCLESGQT